MRQSKRSNNTFYAVFIFYYISLDSSLSQFMCVFKFVSVVLQVLLHCTGFLKKRHEQVRYESISKFDNKNTAILHSLLYAILPLSIESTF